MHFEWDFLIYWPASVLELFGFPVEELITELAEFEDEQSVYCFMLIMANITAQTAGLAL